MESTDVDELKPGTRVRLRAPDPLLELTFDTGTIVEPSEWDFYYIIKLDGPALYHHQPDSIEETHVICEAVENLEILEPR
ncbi:MAG: hypothetical protein Q7O66_06220 [Dehalococcoidia bacterium]|nr:hypothetical protein [Dehalococcoidia bacterium]